MNRKIIKLVLVVFMLLAFKTTAFAAHQFSFKAYNCNKLNDEYECVNDAGNVIEPTLIANNGTIAPGKVIKLDVLYNPDVDNADLGFQARFSYNSSFVESVKYYDEDEQANIILAYTDETTVPNGGIWPSVNTTTQKGKTGWVVQVNDSVSTSQIALMAMDTNSSKKLTTGGVISTMYFKVKDDAPANQSFDFTYNTTYTKMNNKSSVSVSNLSLKTLVELDSDTSLKALTVKSGDTNYLANFNSATKTYDVKVPNNVSSVNVAGTPTKTTTSVVNSVTNPVSLTVGITKTVTLLTTAADGSTDTYTVNIRRMNNDATLKSITIYSNNSYYGYLTPTFDSDITSYEYYYKNAYYKPTITAIANDSNATIAGTGNYNVKENPTVNIVVTAEDGTTKTYTFNFVRQLSGETYLGYLYFEGYPFTPIFNMTTYSYNVTVPYGVDKLKITGAVTDSNSTVTGLGEKSLNVGDNVFTITVTAEDQIHTKDTTVTVHRQEGDASLKSLTLSGIELTPVFNKDTKTYNITVPNNVTSTIISAETTSTLASITEGLGEKSLSVGDNTFVIKTKAEDETITDAYTVKVRRQSSDASLKTLTVTSSEGSLTPAFNKDTFEYTYNAGADVTSITVAAEATQENANIVGTGTFDPGTTNKTNIIVTAEDGTVNTYTINFNRAKSSNTDLDSLSIDGYEYTPSYSNSVDTYSLTIPYNVSTINIDAVAHDPRSTIHNLGNKSVSVGKTLMNISIVAEDGTTRFINFNILRKDGNPLLKLLGVEGYEITPTFNKDIKSYTLTVPYNVTSVKVYAEQYKATTAIAGSGTKNLNVGENIITVTTRAQEQSITDAYTIVITREAPSTNAYLSDLKIDGTTIKDFNKDTFEYTLDNVSNNKDSINIEATKEDSKAALSGAGTKTLAVGNNKFEVKVTAEDGTTTKTYIVNIKRNSNNNKLDTLTVTSEPSGTLDKEFDKDTLEYTYTVGPDAPKIIVDATASSGATIEGTGEYDPKTTEKIEITVTSEDGEEKVYTINVVRNKSTNTDLSNLEVDDYTLTPDFTSSTKSYNLTVDSDVEMVNIVASKSDELQTISGDTGIQMLSTGNNKLTITVTAEDEVTASDYIVNIYRKSSNADLSNLTLDGITLNPVFNKNTLSYEMTVPYSKSSTTITATKDDNKATISGDTGVKNIAVGDNTYSITVTAEDENISKTYSIKVVRESASTNAHLSDLKVDGNTVEGFNKDTFEYTLDPVSNTKESIDITATAEDSNSTVTGTGTKELNVGNNKFEIVVTSESGEDSITYIVNIKRNSNNNKLDTLTVTSEPSGTLDKEFDKDTLEYTYTVGPDAPKIIVDATASSGATIEGTGEYDPKTTEKIEITVTSEDGEEKVYTVNVIRNKSTNNDLLSLAVEGYTIDPTFDKDTLSYSLTVNNDVENVTIVAQVSDERSTITGTGNKTLSVGDNKFTVTVTSEDNTTKDYVININRSKNSDATLKDLKVDNVTVEDFDKNTTSYSLDVPNDTSKVNISATATNELASVAGTGDISLNLGSNEINIIVTAEDGTTKTYTVNINRALSSDATLSDLKVNNETVENFKSDVESYELNVPNDINKVTITGTANEEDATIEGNGDKNLSTGENKFTIKVTAPDGVTTKEYTLTINRDTNDNNYLSSLSVTGYEITPTFNKETLEYTLEVPSSIDSINVSATAEVETSSVAGTGNINLDSNTKEVIITVTSEKGNTRNYKLTVTKVDESEEITSIEYGHVIEDGMIKTVTYKTKPNELKDQLDNENWKLHIYKADTDEEYLDTDNLATGATVKLINNTLKDSKVVVVKGDVDGNGNVTLFDAVKVLNHFLEKETLEGIYYEAADVDSNGNITLFDAVGILRIFLEDND